jgi:patatin-related protein
MREKELRLALICYGGISLAVYMHGITKEIWRLAQASQTRHSPDRPQSKDDSVYGRLLAAIAEECGVDLRVLADILAGASAGGINAIFLAEAISTGRSLDPLTELWLETADVDRLLDSEVSPLSRLMKGAAVPIAWALSRQRGGAALASVDPAQREEVRTKLANFVRSRWFAPPFSGPGFTRLLLDALAAMRKEAAGPPLLPHYQPLDLFVTVTDFHGFPERLRLNSPPDVAEREHRVTLAFRDTGGEVRHLADAAELAFAARATASFPGAFPPFQVGELDRVLAERGEDWPGRSEFLTTALPRRDAIGAAEGAVLIDGSILANAPFGPAIEALARRSARREVDRRFVYIDPKPGIRSVTLGGTGGNDAPGFVATIFGALSDIPREQPIRDNLEAIETRSAHIRRIRRIVEAMRPEVEAAIEKAFGRTLLLMRPTPERLATWRRNAQGVAAREAGYAYSGYAQLKLSTVTEEIAALIVRLGRIEPARQEPLRQAVWGAVRKAGLDAIHAPGGSAAGADFILFMRKFDLSFRIRRLRFVTRAMRVFDERAGAPPATVETARDALYSLIGRYSNAPGEEPLAEAADAENAPEAAMEALAARLDLRALDDEADAAVTAAFASFAKPDRRMLILAYLGFPFYDIATLPLLQGEGLDEFDPIKVDRISPDDATAIREGGAAATLKGIQFNSFGAFFSRAYRENDYLWGRLHGADRLIDITVSALPEGMHLPPGTVAGLKRDAFRAILAEEKPRLTRIAALFAELEGQIG